MAANKVQTQQPVQIVRVAQLQVIRLLALQACSTCPKCSLSRCMYLAFNAAGSPTTACPSRDVETRSDVRREIAIPSIQHLNQRHVLLLHPQPLDAVANGATSSNALSSTTRPRVPTAAGLQQQFADLPSAAPSRLRQVLKQQCRCRSSLPHRDVFVDAVSQADQAHAVLLPFDHHGDRPGNRAGQVELARQPGRRRHWRIDCDVSTTR